MNKSGNGEFEGEPWVIYHLTMEEAIDQAVALSEREEPGECRVTGRLMLGKNKEAAEGGYSRGDNEFALIDGNRCLPIEAEHDVHLRLGAYVEPGATVTLGGELVAHEGQPVAFEVYSWEPTVAWVTPTGARQVKRNYDRDRREADRQIAADEKRLRERYAAWQRGEVDRRGNEPEATEAWAALVGRSIARWDAAEAGAEEPPAAG